MPYKLNFLQLICLLFLSMQLLAQDSRGKAKEKLYERGSGVALQAAFPNSNSAVKNFAASYYLNGIVFLSNRNESGSSVKQGNKLFFSPLSMDNAPLNPEYFGSVTGSMEPVGPVAFGRKGDAAYFTAAQKSNTSSGPATATISKIYETKRGLKSWSAPVALSICTGNANYQNPCLSADGKKLIFASDMAGGAGGFDLWMSIKTGDKWGTPVNLGPQVNTDGSEITPFLHRNGMLFFATKGNAPEDQLEIMFVNLEEQNPVRRLLPPPINSPQNDYAFMLSEDGQSGFVSSSRESSGGGDQLYQFLAPQGFLAPSDVVKVVCDIRVFDNKNSTPLDDVNVSIIGNENNGMFRPSNLYQVMIHPASIANQFTLELNRKRANELKPATGTTSGGGSFSYNALPDNEYVIVAEKPGYVAKEQVITTRPDKNKMTVSMLLEPRTCVLVQGTVTDQKSRQPIANSKITITGAKGDTEVFHTDGAGNFEKCLGLKNSYEIKAEAKGYIFSAMTIDTRDNNVAKVWTPALRLLPISNMEKAPDTQPKVTLGSKFLLENIAYDFNNYSIKPGGSTELDAIVVLMLNAPSLTLEAGAHTDTRGAKDANQQLSEKRALAAKNYLISRGIAADRITAVGYGENFPRNKCIDGTPCSDADHQYNNRLEFKVTRLDGSLTSNQPLKM